MGNLSTIGRIFFGISIADIGFQTIYYHDFPYMVLPPDHSWIPLMLVYVFGTLLILAGACIVFEKKTRPASLVLGGVLLSIFCFYYIPYQFMAASNYMSLVEWENAEKELALASGAFVIAGRFSGKNENRFYGYLAKLIPFGAILFSITMISFGIVHFLVAKEAATLVPSWIPGALFWTYLAGVALICSGIAIILKIKRSLAATLLGTMIFSWFLILHIPRVVASPVADLEGEVPSAFLALAYSGIAFVIAGASKNFAQHEKS
jgi:uncharacterized membrane protein